MKELKLNDLTLYYDFKLVEGYSKDYYSTNIYIGYSTSTRSKYFFFGPIIDTKNYNYAFTLDYDITDATISKEKIKKDLRQNVDRYFAIKYRMKEIENGNII